MSVLTNRPTARFRPGEGLLRNEHFQIAWVTTDIARAAATFRDRYGIARFHEIDARMAGGGELKVHLAWAGGYMVELIEAHGPGTAFYTEKLPTQGFGTHFHHLGYLVEDAAGWDALMAEIERGGWTIRSQNQGGGPIRHVYVEMPELGHFLEYLLLEPSAVALFESLPAS